MFIVNGRPNLVVVTLLLTSGLHLWTKNI